MTIYCRKIDLQGNTFKLMSNRSTGFFELHTIEKEVVCYIEELDDLLQIIDGGIDFLNKNKGLLITSTGAEPYYY